MVIILIIRSFLLSWWLANFQPWQSYLNKSVKPHITNAYIKKSLSCHQCLGFWSCLAIGAFMGGFYPFEAITVACVAFSYEKVLNALPHYL